MENTLKKNILLVADTSPCDPSSGSERVLYHHALGLVHEGARVSVLARDGGGRGVWDNPLGCVEASYAADPNQHIGFFRSLLRQPARLFDRLSAEGPFDAAVCHHPFTYFALLVARRLKNIPVLHVFHSPTHEEYLLLHEDRHPAVNWLPAKGRFLVERSCHRQATRTMVLSEYMKDRVASKYGINRNRILVNAGGVDLERFTPARDRSRVKKKRSLDPEKIQLLTIRNLEPRMGLDNLLGAFRRILDQGIPAHLTIGGQGVEKERLQSQARELGLASHVTFTGYIPADILPEYYQAADFFILPTRKLEGFGLVTVEALACGTPVLGTPVGGTREILPNLGAEFLFENNTPAAIARGTAAALSQYAPPSGAYTSLRKRCRDYAQKNYSWDRHVNQLNRTLDSLIQERGKTQG